MKLHVLVILLDGGAVEASIYETRAEAERSAAEQIMEKMLTESALDLSGILTSMDRAFLKKEYADVIRFFERIKRRKAIFIQECQVRTPIANGVN
jgi:hypothetical protein